MPPAEPPGGRPLRARLPHHNDIVALRLAVHKHVDGGVARRLIVAQLKRLRRGAVQTVETSGANGSRVGCGWGGGLRWKEGRKIG